MLSREDAIKGISDDDRRWIARCQMVAVILFLALLAGIVLWPVLVHGDAGVYDTPDRSLQPGRAQTPDAPGFDKAEAP